VNQNRTTRAAARILILGAGPALAGHANAQTLISDVTYQYLGPTLGVPIGVPADPSAAYSSVAVTQGGAGPGSAGGTPYRTPVMADDFLPIASSFGKQVQTIRLIAWNSSGANRVAANTQVGFWRADGSNAAPNSYFFEGTSAVGFSTPRHDFEPGYTLITLSLGASGFTLPSERLWLGMAFEQSYIGSDPAGFTDVASMGYRGITTSTVGSTTVDGATMFTYGVQYGQSARSVFANQGANFAMELVVPAPSSLMPIGAGWCILRRRRRVG